MTDYYCNAQSLYTEEVIEQEIRHNLITLVTGLRLGT